MLNKGNTFENKWLPLLTNITTILLKAKYKWTTDDDDDHDDGDNDDVEVLSQDFVGFFVSRCWPMFIV